MKLFDYIKGDKLLWAVIFLISMISFLPVYSASSNLQYVVGSGTSFSHFTKHAGFIVIGLIFVIVLQHMDYKYFGGIAVLLLPIALIGLAATLYQGTTIEGGNAARWLKLPGIPFAFQTSTFAALTLLIYLCRYLTKTKNKIVSFGYQLLYLFLPMILIIGLIFPANGSTAFMLALMCMTILFIGGYPIKNLFIIGITMIVFGAIFILAVIKFGDKIGSNRVETWKNRIENFSNPEKTAENYQVRHAKAAIVEGGVIGKGPGKSALKQTLPQSSSDFIFAIIVEEYGWIGICVVSFFFIFMLYRFMIIASKIHTDFGTLIVFAAGFPIIFQAIINMAVAVNLIPVTGQPLPLISYGGTSMWVTYIGLGIIVSVSRQIKTKEELELELKNKSEEAIQDIA